MKQKDRQTDSLLVLLDLLMAAMNHIKYCTATNNNSTIITNTSTNANTNFFFHLLFIINTHKALVIMLFLQCISVLY